MGWEGEERFRGEGGDRWVCLPTPSPQNPGLGVDQTCLTPASDSSAHLTSDPESASYLAPGVSVLPAVSHVDGLYSKYNGNIKHFFKYAIFSLKNALFHYLLWIGCYYALNFFWVHLQIKSCPFQRKEHPLCPLETPEPGFKI